MAAEPPDQLAATGDQPRLGSAAELVAAGGDQVGAGGEDGVEHRLAAEAGVEPRRVAERAAPRVLEEEQAVLAGHRRTLGGGRPLGEADHAEIRRVDADDGRGARGHRGCVVGGAGAVGGADVDHPGAAEAHHLGDAEAAADLHRLPTGDEHLAPPAERAQHEQHRGGVVRRDQGVLGPAEGGEEGGDVVVARAPGPPAEVVLEVRVPRRRGHRGARRRPQRRPAQVGVDDDAGGVEDAVRPRLETAAQPGGGGGGEPVLVTVDRAPGAPGGALRVEHGAGGTHQRGVGAAPALQQGMAGEPVDRGQVARRRGSHEESALKRLGNPPTSGKSRVTKFP